MASSHVSRYYRECIKKLERKGLFAKLTDEETRAIKAQIHESIRLASSKAYMSGSLS
jgi:hypothetical protein